MMNGRTNRVNHPDELNSVEDLNLLPDANFNGNITNGTNSDYATKSSGMDSESDISSFSHSSEPETSPPMSHFTDQTTYDEPIAIIGMGM
jgi:hypothetical protein